MEPSPSCSRLQRGWLRGADNALAGGVSRACRAREAGIPRFVSQAAKLLESLGQLAQLLLECPDAITELLAQSDQRLTLFQATVVPVEKPRRRTMEKRGEPREMSVGDDGSCLVALKERAVTPRLAASSR